MTVSNVMFCPKCGNADQMPESYCRQCGLYLLDFSKPLKRKSPPEEHLKANTVLSVMTIVASFTLSFLLFLVLGFRPFTHPLIYLTAGVLLAIGGWHIQTLIRTLMLKKQWKRRVPLSEIQASPSETPIAFKSASTAKLLNQADPADAIPVSVTEHTTRHLSGIPQTKSR
jgi:hypothetical protein